MIVDAHAHLNRSEFDNCLEEVVEKCLKNGVGKIVNAAWDVKSAERALFLAEKYDFMYFTAGIHPSDIGTATEKDYVAVADLCDHPKCVAVGEIGLDYYRDHSPRDFQRGCLEYQLEIAKDKGMPVVLHVRDAYQDCNDIMARKKDCLSNGVLLHCYSGSKELITEVYNKYDCYYSFGGTITFKTAKKGDVLRAVPLNRILTETDCPYMTPEPHRGKQNDPSYIPYVRDKMATELGLDPKELERTIEVNFDNLYRIKQYAEK